MKHQILYSYILLIVLNFIMSVNTLYTVIESNDKLNTLEEELQRLLKNHTDINLSISGLAYVYSLDGSNYYSASLYSNDINNDNKNPAYYDEIFKNPDNKLNGFKYKTTEIITFKTNIAIPKPGWRVQIKYI